MKVVAVNGSNRAGGNTALLVRETFKPLEAAGIECELIELAHKKIGGCTSCGKCSEKRDGICYGRADDAQPVLAAAQQADAVILASPVYYGDVSPEMKAFIDRLGMVGRASGQLVRKPGTGIIAVRRAGAMHALDSLLHLFGISEMPIITSTYWNIGIGREAGDVLDDAEGLATMKRLGENMAFFLAKLKD